MNQVRVTARWTVIDEFVVCTRGQQNRYGNLLTAESAIVVAIVHHFVVTLPMPVIRPIVAGGGVELGFASELYHSSHGIVFSIEVLRVTFQNVVLLSRKSEPLLRRFQC